MALRALALATLILFTFPAHSNGFDEYASGAMKVYTQFKTYSKADSERFYTFVKNSWDTRRCITQCEKAGEDIGKQYAKIMKVELEQDEI